MIKNKYKILLDGKSGENFDEGLASFYGDYYGSQKKLNPERLFLEGGIPYVFPFLKILVFYKDE